ncbi:CAP domain-containing protein [Croceitalea sp. MTPC9]|uniref:CAP domain-containing protein n=1 Tax=unclassified Croceitalea TaxID=2632280 RepID=UPI002B3E2889|nr:CAP domain-containing protein [Croceitalea sp. MTPC6]GMN16783.1 CAP domain-containing protein [Croceitalea sp. MTPC9]
MRTAVFLRQLFFIGILFTLSCSSESREEIVQLNSVNDIKLETQVMELINSHRESLSLSPLILNVVAYNYANDHNDYMISKGSISHDNFNVRASKISSEANAKEVGENVAKDYLSAKAVFEGWINSPEHKENIESDFTHTGLSVKKDSNGNLYYTHIFFK